MLTLPKPPAEDLAKATSGSTIEVYETFPVM